MRKRIHTLIYALLVYKRHIKYAFRFKRLLRLLHIPNKKASEEDAYVKLWKKLYAYVEPYSYRLFRNYCGDSPYIVPEDIGHSFIEPGLNPKAFTPFYEDKNILSVLLPEDAVPHTILCRIQGGEILDVDRYKAKIGFNASAESYLNYIKVSRIVLKPSINSNSGKGVMLFVRNTNRYMSSDGKQVLDGQFLQQYGMDWVLQEAITQHPYMSHFCSTSVNTIRVNTYRSATDEQVHILSAAVRIGHDGSIVDNLHQGGGLVGVDVETGALKQEVLDQYGNRTNALNGIDFSREHFEIPKWEEIMQFCREMAFRNTHCRLIALDIAIKEDGKPVLIEWNVTPYSFSYWIPMMTGVTPFGALTEEIVEYVKSKKYEI